MDFKEKSIKKISFILKFHRRVNFLSQQELAEKIGISQRNYQRIENGEVEPKLETLSLISRVLEVPITSFFDEHQYKVLHFKEHLESNELQNYLKNEESLKYRNDPVQFARYLINEDKKQSKNAPLYAGGEVYGNKAELSSELTTLGGFKSSSINVDDYLAIGTAAERWEIIFRKNIINPVLENALILPNGFFVFEEYHYNMNLNIDNPSTHFVVRDITHRHTIETWLRKCLKK